MVRPDGTPTGATDPNLPAETRREIASRAGKVGGVISGQVRRAKREREKTQRPDQLARGVFQKHAEQLARVLIDAALGHGDFKSLDAKDRANFAVKALEYGVGRPRPLVEEPPPVERTEDGLHFQLGPDVPPAPDGEPNPGVPVETEVASPPSENGERPENGEREEA